MCEEHAREVISIVTNEWLCLYNMLTKTFYCMEAELVFHLTCISINGALYFVVYKLSNVWWCVFCVFSSSNHEKILKNAYDQNDYAWWYLTLKLTAPNLTNSFFEQ